MISTYPDLDPYFAALDEPNDIAQCALRACEEVLFDRADDIEDGYSEIACQSEILTDERVASCVVSISGEDLSIKIVTNEGETIQLKGLISDDIIEAIT